MIITDTPGTAFEKVSMDIVGLLPVTQKLNEYILTIQDNFTKYSLAIPLPNSLTSTTRRNSSLQNLVLLYLFLLKVNRKRGYNVTFLEITILNIKQWSY